MPMRTAWHSAGGNAPQQLVVGLAGVRALVLYVRGMVVQQHDMVPAVLRAVAATIQS